MKPKLIVIIKVIFSFFIYYLKDQKSKTKIFQNLNSSGIIWIIIIQKNDKLGLKSHSD